MSNESEVPQIEQEQEVVEPISEEVNKDKSVTEKERQDLVKSLNKRTRKHQKYQCMRMEKTTTK